MTNWLNFKPRKFAGGGAAQSDPISLILGFVDSIAKLDNNSETAQSALSELIGAAFDLEDPNSQQAQGIIALAMEVASDEQKEILNALLKSAQESIQGATEETVSARNGMMLDYFKCGGKTAKSVKKAKCGTKATKNVKNAKCGIKATEGVKVKKCACGSTPVLKRVGGTIIAFDCNGNRINYAEDGIKITSSVRGRSVSDNFPGGGFSKEAMDAVGAGKNDFTESTQIATDPIISETYTFSQWLNDNAADYKTVAARRALAAKYAKNGIKELENYKPDEYHNMILWKAMKADLAKKKQEGYDNWSFGDNENLYKQPVDEETESDALVKKADALIENGATAQEVIDLLDPDGTKSTEMLMPEDVDINEEVVLETEESPSSILDKALNESGASEESAPKKKKTYRERRQERKSKKTEKKYFGGYLDFSGFTFKI